MEVAANKNKRIKAVVGAVIGIVFCMQKVHLLGILIESTMESCQRNEKVKKKKKAERKMS